MTNDQPPSGVPPIEPTPQAAVPPPPVVDPYAAYPPGYAGVYYPPAPPRGLAIASMVLGIVGVFFSFGYGFGLFPSIAAVITGHLSRKRQPYARGMWLTGLICGYTGIGISLLWIAGLIALAFFLIANPGGIDSGDYSLT